MNRHYQSYSHGPPQKKIRHTITGYYKSNQQTKAMVKNYIYKTDKNMRHKIFLLFSEKCKYIKAAYIYIYIYIYIYNIYTYIQIFKIVSNCCTHNNKKNNKKLEIYNKREIIHVNMCVE